MKIKGQAATSLFLWERKTLGKKKRSFLLGKETFRKEKLNGKSSRKKKMRKSQAATEFMMTYGWMIFVVIVIIGTLFAMGVFDIKVQNTCYIPDPYKCLDVKFNSNNQELTLKISSSGIDKSANNQVVANGIKLNGNPCSIVGSNSLASSEDAPVDVKCDYSVSGRTIKKEKKFEGTIVLQYKKYGGSNLHVVNGKFGGSSE